MTTVLNILESLDSDEGLERHKLEKSLKLTKKLDRNNLNIFIQKMMILNLKSLD